jgi:hypothetical protein
MENQDSSQPVNPALSHDAPQKPPQISRMDISNIYPSAEIGQPAQPILTQEQMAVKNDNGSITRRDLYAPIGITVIALLNIFVSGYQLIGPGDLYMVQNGHIVVHHIPFFSPIVAIIKYHTHKGIVGQIISLIIGLILGIGLLRRAEIARIITVIFLFLALIGLSIGILTSLPLISHTGRNIFGKTSFAGLLILLWTISLAQLVYLTRPTVKAHFS